MRLMTKLAFALGLAAALPAASHAQAVQPASPVAGQVRYRGTIDAVDGRVVRITTRTGQHVAVTVPPEAPVAVVVNGDMSDVKLGSFIGSAAHTLPDGTLEAMEVHVFAPELRGTREGHYPWDLAPASTMTNGTAVGQAVGNAARILTVNYAGGQELIKVPEDMKIQLVSKGAWSDMKPGEAVIMGTLRAADGTITASYATVGRGGVKPPM